MDIALYSIGGIILLVIILSFLLPTNYEVKREVVINNPILETFEFLKFVKNQNVWSPWKLKDPNMEQSYEGTDGEVGFISKWKGNKDVGEGEQEITAIVEGQSINTELRFFKPWKSVSNGYLLVDEIDANHTKVTWGFTGINPRPFNIMTLFFPFEKAVGSDFEAGLNSLKQHIESK